MSEAPTWKDQLGDRVPEDFGREIDIFETEIELRKQDKIDEVKMAVIEACLNALEHSQAKRRRFQVIFSVLGSAEPEVLQITVRDKGVGFSPPENASSPDKAPLSRRGWGLQIIEGLMDEVRIESGSTGTTVVMCKTR
mgnify:CR=1 FL=1